MAFELAQVNIARLTAPLESAELAGFVAALDPVNAAADQAPGFVWRLQTEDGNATSIQAFEWDAAGSAGVIVNMSVWTDIGHLGAFVFGEMHRQVLRRRREWFQRMQRGAAGVLVGARRAPPRYRRGGRPGPAPARARPRALRVHAAGQLPAARRRAGAGGARPR